MEDEGLVITRDFDAPAEEIWRAWTEPDYLATWWGPKDFTIPVCKIDFRLGGKNLICMRSPEGKDFWSTGEYSEILPGRGFTCSDSFADQEGNVVPATYYGFEEEMPLEMRVELRISGSAEKCVMTLRHIGLPPGIMREMTGQGWNESFDKLEKIVNRKKSI